MIKVKQYIRTYGKGKFEIFLFFQVKEDNKALGQAYGDDFPVISISKSTHITLRNIT